MIKNLDIQESENLYVLCGMKSHDSEKKNLTDVEYQVWNFNFDRLTVSTQWSVSAKKYQSYRITIVQNNSTACH